MSAQEAEAQSSLSVSVNARAVFLGYREAAKQMIEQGKGGCIVGM